MSQHPTEATRPAPRYPWYVRALAVAYVLSFAAQPVGFVVFAAAAGLRFVLLRDLDAWVVGLAAGAVAVVVLCPAFRWGFRTWGRATYGDGPSP